MLNYVVGGVLIGIIISVVVWFYGKKDSKPKRKLKEN